jgi:hypothetical protein
VYAFAAAALGVLGGFHRPGIGLGNGKVSLSKNRMRCTLLNLLVLFCVSGSLVECDRYVAAQGGWLKLCEIRLLV